MKIDNVIEELKAIRKIHGNIEVTCTSSTLADAFCASTSFTKLQGHEDIFETTVV